MTQAYLYKWVEKTTGKWYIGSRTRKNCHPNDGYICSSQIVKPLIKLNPNNWERVILVIGNPLYIRNLESDLLLLLNAANNVMSYNQHNGARNWCTTGKSPTIQTREKLSKVRKGKPKSLHMRQALSKSKKGKSLPEYIKLKISKTLTGKKHSNETKQKLSQARKGKKLGPMSQETKEKLSKALKGRKLSEETRKKMSESKQHVSLETRQKLSQAAKGRKFSQETIEKIRASNIKTKNKANRKDRIPSTIIQY